MNKLFLCCLWLLLLSNKVSANTVWDKEINTLVSSLALNHSSNIYNQSKDKIQDQNSVLRVNYTALKLFEGYGIKLPINVAHTNYVNESHLNSNQFSITPQLRVFLSDYSNININLAKQVQYQLPGSENTEFVTNNDLSLIKTQNFGANLKLGRSPNQRFIDLSLNHSNRLLTNNTQAQSDISTLDISFVYGHKISEDTYFLVDLGSSKEDKNDSESNINKMGGGFLTKAGGNHELRLVIGGFKRSGLTMEQGYYWQVTDKWKILEHLALNLLTSRESEVAYSQETLTQVRTRHHISLTHELNDNHQLKASLEASEVGFDHNKRKLKSYKLGINWQWQILDYLSAQVALEQSLLNDSHLNKNRDQRLLNLSIGYSW